MTIKSGEKLPDLWGLIDEHLMKKPPLSVERMPTFYPSSASCKSEVDGSIIGSCMRENYYRCAGYERSDPNTVWSEYVFAGGKLWEEWIIQQAKEAGIFRGNNIKFVDIEKYISGELDLVVHNPSDVDETIIAEIKTFYGYMAHAQILGTYNQAPSPKDSHLLQAFLYLGHFKEQVNRAVLMYFARDDHERNQFVIERVVGKDGKTYPKIYTEWKKNKKHDGWYSYVDERITLEGIYARYDELMETLKKGEVPIGDYRHSYTEDEIKERWEAGLISKTAYAQYEKDKDPYALGHFMCRRYCNYRSMCLAQKKEEGQL